MKIKVTPQAASKLQMLSEEVRERLAGTIADAHFPDVDLDRRLDVEEYSGDLWVRPVADGEVNLVYHFNDIDDDGVQDVVLLSIVTRDELAPDSSRDHGARRPGRASRLAGQLTESLATTLLE